jgi:phosphoesterase RecJ-like protein
VTGVAETPVRAVDGLDWDAALEAIGRAGSILLACHLNPDGDALGSMLAAGQGLAQLGRPVQASFPSPFTLPEVFAELPGRELLVPADEADPAPDLLITFDAGSADRLGDLAGRLGTAGTVLVLDHHASNTRFGTLNLVDPTAAATGVLVDELLTRLGARLTPEIAECLYVAVSTDTGSFKYEATTPAVHELAARLLATGIRHDEISRRLYDTRPFGALRLLADTLSRTTLEAAAAGGAGLVWSYATLDDLARHGQRPEALESLIDVVRTTAEAEVACVAKQLDATGWAVSLRSKGGTDVSRVAVALGGGGHRFAAGFTGRGPVEQVIAAVRAQLD